MTGNGQAGAGSRVLIVGGGRAGVAAAEELRRLQFRGEIVLLHDETVMPYDRPACAKGLLTGQQRPGDVALSVTDAQDVQWLLGRRAVHLDLGAQTVLTDTDEVFVYDGLVIAGGAGPVAPPGWPTGVPGPHVLYRVADAWALRGALEDAATVAVIGAGLTGCEVAHAVRSLARDCVLIDSKPCALARPLGEQAGRLITREIARDGVDLRFNRRVDRLVRRRRGWTVALDNGDEVAADLVVACTGERPDTDWLAGCPSLDVSDGVLCDEKLRVVGTHNVVAAGTVARWPNLRYSTTPVRIGQWITAMEQGRAAARALLTSADDLPPFTHVPRFWSNQFGLQIQMCGRVPDPGSERSAVSVTEQRPRRRDTARAGVVLGYHVDDDLVGLVAVNAPHAFTTVTRTMLATARARVSTSRSVPAQPPAGFGPGSPPNGISQIGRRYA